MRWLLVSLAACNYAPTPGGTTPGDDASGVDAPASVACFGTFGKVCVPVLPTEAFSLSGGSTTITTDILASCVQTAVGTTVTGCLIVGTTITIDGSLVGIGARPLILLATEGSISITTAGVLDVASRDAMTRGAGANPLGLCDGGTAPTTGTSAGGAGGSLAGRGGNGGTGTLAGTGGVPNPEGIPTTLRGGCQGALGGNPAAALAGGNGGGAVLLIATMTIRVDGAINASGEGGDGGLTDLSVNRGGAGGGSGGMIVFDALQLAITGRVMAQGGAGAEGNTPGPSGSGLTGGRGEDPMTTGTAAVGGRGGGGQNGGDGATDNTGENGDNGSVTSGGGGGGGAGMIKNVSAQTTNTGTVTPPLR